MIADVEEKTKEVINAAALSAMCKLVGIGEATMDGHAPLETATYLAQHGEEACHTIIDKYILDWPVPNKFTGKLIAKKGVPLSDWWLTCMPGDYDVLVSTRVEVHKNYRGRGLGSLLHGYRLDIARLAHASAIICTVRTDNVFERKILKKFDWKEMRGYVPFARRPGGPDPSGVQTEFWIKEL